MTALETRKYLIKGTAFHNLKSYLGSEGGSGYYDQIASRAGLSQKLILSSSWYDAEKYYEIQRIAAEELGFTLRRLVLDMSTYTLQVDLNGVYRFFMKVGGARRILARFDRLLSTYSNYGSMKILTNEESHFQFLLEFPTQFFEIGIYGLEGGITGILSLCNRELVNFHTSNRQEYQIDGADITSLTFDVQYH